MKKSLPKVLLASSGFYPILSGASYVMTTYVNELKDIKFYVITSNTFPTLKKIQWNEHQIYYVFNRFYKISSKMENILGFKQIPWLTRIIRTIITKYQIDIVIGVYPAFPLFFAAYQASKVMKKKFIPYFHDLILSKQKNVIEKIIDYSLLVVVINSEMKEYFKRKFREKKIFLLNFPVSRSDMKFHLSLPFRQPGKRVRFVWAGNIHGGNSKSLDRLFSAVGELGGELCILTSNKFTMNLNIPTKWSLHRIRERTEYLEFISKCDFGLVSLDWEDEASLEKDELRVALPTKVIDYAIARTPVIAHCPQGYNLAKFLNGKGIGVVANKKNKESVKQAVEQALKSYRYHSENTTKVIEEFGFPNAQLKFNKILDFADGF